MEKFVVRKNSSLYQIASLGGWSDQHEFDDEDWYREEYGNICAFTKYFLKGLLTGSVLLLIILLASACVSDFFTWLVVMIMEQRVIEPGIGTQIVVGCMLGPLVICGIAFFAEYLENKMFTAPKIVSDIRQMTKSYFSKYCIPIEFKKDE